MYRFRPHSLITDKMLRSIHAWEDRMRNPSLAILLILELCAIDLAAPLAAKGIPLARVFADARVLAVRIVVVMLSPRLGSIILIPLGLTGDRREPSYSLGNCRTLLPSSSTGAAISSSTQRWFGQSRRRSMLLAVLHFTASRVRSCFF